MKSRTSVVFAVLVIVLLFGVYHEFGDAASSKKDFLPARIGVVNVQQVLLAGDKNKSWDTIIRGEGERMRTELVQLRDEIVAGEGKLKTKSPDSSDYTRLERELMEKAANLKAKEEFFQQDMMSRQHRWAEKSFREVLTAAETVAKDKGLDIVLVREDYQWPVNSANELVNIMRTSKVLYNSEELDITDAVLAAWNAAK
ncbi:MAG: OmpH family outer membrane protein [Planctomycetes bacterium]|nr:OmpH family outer membrane protein [Planctomycetota bacterium]